MKKKIITYVLGSLLFGSLANFSCSATSKDDSKNDILIEITEKNDGNLLTKTEKENNQQEGKIVSITLNKTNETKEFSDEKLKVIAGNITKILEKEFNAESKKNINNLISNVRVGKDVLGGKNISFEINFFKDIKSDIENFVKNIFDNKDLKDLKNSLKEIAKRQFEGKNSKEFVDEVVKDLDKKIEDAKNKKQLLAEGSFPFVNLFNNFTIEEDDSLDDLELKQNLQQMRINNLEKKKQDIQNYANNLKIGDIYAVIDSITSINANGNFSRVSSSFKQVSSTAK